MALQGEAKKLYQRALMRKRREAKKEAVTVAVKSGEQVTLEWDAEKYPVKGAWEVAAARAERARRYARKFPQFIKPSEECYADVEWQYENEGLKAVPR